MRITSAEQLDELLSVVGEQNVAGCKRALADGCKIWVFLSREEVDQDPDLEQEGREFCCQRFGKGETWAGWLEQPESKTIVGVNCGPKKYGH